MSAGAQVLLQDGADALRRRVMLAEELSFSGRAHVAWVFRQDTPSGDDLATLAATASANFASSRSYHDVAVLGYAADAAVLDEELRQILRGGLAWLCGRSPEIDGEPAGFFADAVALLGVALGARALGDDANRAAADWMLKFTPRAATLPSVETWQKCLLVAALHVVGRDTGELPREAGTADVRTALRARGVLSDSSSEELETDERLTLNLLKEQAADNVPAVRAAMRLAAFAWVRRSAPVVVPGRVTVGNLIQLLDRVPAGLRRWAWEAKPRTRSGQARRWHIDHEYHVQDLLYFLLAPAFPDLKDEEYFESLGQKQPRTDLFIPSMKLVIEVKFLRPSEKVTKVIDELAADASLYLADGSDYSGIVAFVWDDSRRSEEHPLLRDGLLKIKGILGAVVVSRPGTMI